MKLYTNKLPKCCLLCQLACPEEQRCVDRATMNCDTCEGRPKTCPLRLLNKKKRRKNERRK